MGRGIVESGLFRAERIEVEQRTSDPSSTTEGEMWLRTDVAPDTDQLATLRVDNGSGTWDIPVFDDAASTGQDVTPALRCRVSGTTGFAPATETGAFPPLRFQYNGSAVQLHDALEAVPEPTGNVLQLGTDNFSAFGSGQTFGITINPNRILAGVQVTISSNTSEENKTLTIKDNNATILTSKNVNVSVGDKINLEGSLSQGTTYIVDCSDQAGVNSTSFPFSNADMDVTAGWSSSSGEETTDRYAFQAIEGLV